uniref:Uncharacterized protein n=1 Tax=Arundo donax TaxID=35708 RepID=A0A0A9B3W1_ARUDO
MTNLLRNNAVRVIVSDFFTLQLLCQPALWKSPLVQAVTNLIYFHHHVIISNCCALFKEQLTAT